MQELTKTHILILANKSEVVNLFTELDIAFNSIEGQTVDQLKVLVERKYQQKRNSLGNEWEELKSKGDNQRAEQKGNYNTSFDKRYQYFLNTIDNIGFSSSTVDPKENEPNPKNYKRLITTIIFSLLAIFTISFFAILYIQTKKELTNLIKEKQRVAEENGKEQAKIELIGVFKIKEDSLKLLKEKEQKAFELKFKYNKDSLISNYKKLIENQKKEADKSLNALNDANTKIKNKDADITKHMNEINILKKSLAEESKKQKPETISVTSQEPTPPANKEIKDNGIEPNPFEELLKMKNDGEIKSFEINISEKSNNKDETIKLKVKNIKERINKSGKK